MVKLGDVVRDTITGFTGVAVCTGQWLHGCGRVTVQPQELHEGKPIEAVTFDELQLEVVKPMGHTPKTGTGGPRPEPVRR